MVAGKYGCMYACMAAEAQAALALQYLQQDDQEKKNHKPLGFPPKSSLRPSVFVSYSARSPDRFVS